MAAATLAARQVVRWPTQVLALASLVAPSGQLVLLQTTPVSVAPLR